MNPYWFIVGGSSLAQFLLFLRWLHRRTRDDEIRSAFVRDMALTHLPYLHQALRKIGTRLGLDLPDPPSVRFIELNGHDRKH